MGASKVTSKKYSEPYKLIKIARESFLVDLKQFLLEERTQLTQGETIKRETTM
jgi:hypothetical protein